MERTNQKGSVLGFIVIGIILAGMLVGGIYLVNRQTTQPHQPTAVQKPAQDKQTPSPAKPGGSTPSPSESQPASGSATPPGNVAELPATGSTETVGALVALGLLSAVTVGYIRSRRSQFSL